MLVVNLSMLGTRPTGLGVYAERCARALSERFEISVVAGNGFVPEAPRLASAPASVAIGAGKGAAIKRALWARSVALPGVRLLYSPTHHALPRAGRQVITIHDLICLRFPKQHRMQYWYFRYLLPGILKRCTAVFTVSETTRRDIAEHYGFPLERIHVVPNGVDSARFAPQAGEPKTSGEPYLLMVGARYPHKNVQEVLSVGSLWSGKYKLVVASCGGEYRAQLEAQATSLGLLDRIEFLDYVDDARLRQLYREAAALLYPSHWEGFGIPPLEALASGTQVIAADIPVLREVLGDAAQFVSLGSPSSWEVAIAGLEDASAESSRKQAASAVLEKFTWERSADALQSALLSVDAALDLKRRG